MEGWISVGAIVLLIFAMLIASEFSKIAGEKGYHDSKYFWYSFLFGFIGMLMVIALPDRGKCTAQPVELPTESEPVGKTPALPISADEIPEL